MIAASALHIRADLAQSRRFPYLEVGGVHTQGEGVQLAEIQKTFGQVVDFAHSISNSVHHRGAVLLH